MTHYPFTNRRATRLEIAITLLFVASSAMVLFPLFVPHQRSHLSDGQLDSLQQRQIAQGLLQYMTDYDEQFPPGQSRTSEIYDTHGKRIKTQESFEQSWGPARELPDGRKIPGLVSVYLKNDRLFVAPDQHHPFFYQNRTGLYYMYNDLLIGANLSELTYPMRTVLLVDAENRPRNVGHALATNSGPEDSIFNSQNSCDPGKGATIGDAQRKYSGGLNFVFGDGHAKWLRTKDVFFPPRESVCKTAIDPKTHQQIGPISPEKPGNKQYYGTFYIANK